MDKIKQKQPDLIERYREISKLKMKAYSKNPHVFNFLGSLYVNGEQLNLPEELRSRVEEDKKRTFAGLFASVDTSLFREDIPAERIKKLIHWAVEGYEKELMEELRDRNLAAIDFGPYWEEFHNFLDELKMVFYRREESADGNN